MTVAQKQVVKHRAEWEWKGEGDKNCSYGVGVGGDFFLILFFLWGGLFSAHQFYPQTPIPVSNECSLTSLFDTGR